jgi:hypothetical protein
VAKNLIFNFEQEAMFAQSWAEFNLPMWDELTAAVLVQEDIITQSGD